MESDDENLLEDTVSDPFLLPVDDRKPSELSQDDSAVNDPVLQK